tara:strand:+ start:1561 stop:2496 length:936 start_codon:yes stop_codon:yes gene_type:complete
MSISVASYLMGIPPGNTNPEKPAIIVNAIEGVWKAGDTGTIVTDYNVVDADVAVMQGFVHPGSKNSKHLDLRRRVIEHQQKRGKRTLIVDANLFLYADPGNSNKFLRYSYDGIFPTTGEYCNGAPDPKRWEIIKNKIGLQLKPWKNSGRYILICCQRDGGWSMDNQPLLPWVVRTIQEIRKYSDRTIVVRFHPGDKNQLEHKRSIARYRLPNVRVSNADSIMHDLAESHCLVNHNSSPGVVAAIEGVPVFLTDAPRSQAKDVAHTNFADLEQIKQFDRQPWIEKMAMMHWSLDELKDGSAWKHLRQWADKR